MNILPDHYNSSQITAWDVISDWHLGFDLGNAVKYIQRHRLKGTPQEDLKKALTYLNHYLESTKDKAVFIFICDEKGRKRKSEITVSKLVDDWRLPDQLNSVLTHIRTAHVHDARVDLDMIRFAYNRLKIYIDSTFPMDDET